MKKLRELQPLLKLPKAQRLVLLLSSELPYFYSEKNTH